MAYTLNNHQPVICTLVADQPFFYMEEESAEEDIFTDDDFAQIEKELETLRRTIDHYDHMAERFSEDPHAAQALFAEEAAFLCIPKGKTQNAKEEGQEIAAISARISQSRMGKALLDFAARYGVTLAHSTQVGTARYDRVGRRILIHPALGDTEKIYYTAQELRRHWHHRKGVMVNPLTFHPDQAIIVGRAQRADLTVMVIRIAWELNLAGDKDLWGMLENGPMSDLARAFAREAFGDFRSLANGTAAAAVFEAWFLSERCRHQDKKLIQAMLSDHQGYVFANETASRSITLELLSALGEQPYGKNYLAPYTRHLLEDPVFTEVRDRSNANFLWFIKFERSFRETEQALQETEDTAQSGVLPVASSRKDLEPSPHDQLSVEKPVIIALKPHRQASPPPQFPAKANAARANVIHVRFGQGEGASKF